MSTRATYQFGLEFGGKVTFYIHHDGYLEGAAHYFMVMHKTKASSPNSGMADRFHRGNLNAEITGGHDSHGDTEYRYTMTAKGILKADKRINFSEEWETVYNGPYQNFINLYHPEIKNDPKLRLYEVPSKFNLSREWLTMDQLSARIMALSEELTSYKINHPKATGNINSMESDLEHWLYQLQNLKLLSAV